MYSFVAVKRNHIEYPCHVSPTPCRSVTAEGTGSSMRYPNISAGLFAEDGPAEHPAHSTQNALPMINVRTWNLMR